MPEIEFTQYLRPDGRRELVTIDVPQATFDRAATIVAAGFKFECEVLTTGHVSLTIADPNTDMDAAIELVRNGPKVPGAVERLIAKFDVSRALVLREILQREQES